MTRKIPGTHPAPQTVAAAHGRTVRLETTAHAADQFSGSEVCCKLDKGSAPQTELVGHDNMMMVVSESYDCDAVANERTMGDFIDTACPPQNNLNLIGYDQS
jgi:hypothetical protein